MLVSIQGYVVVASSSGRTLERHTPKGGVPTSQRRAGDPLHVVVALRIDIQCLRATFDKINHIATQWSMNAQSKKTTVCIL